MTRKKIWLDFLGWFRPAGREVPVARHVMETAATSTDLASPFVLGTAEAISDGAGGASPRDLAVATFADETTLPEFDEVELREFMAADDDPVTADPAFREQLRDRLWTLVLKGGITRPKNH